MSYKAVSSELLSLMRMLARVMLLVKELNSVFLLELILTRILFLMKVMNSAFVLGPQLSPEL